ncbi:hypothetical protein EVAR_86166_1 [Eumeta japonica]|uniref:Uncharacterized protein n=1 Tax=Eumeta variegata TaxID=151549 RepID=A0A4C1Z4D5_EUMVA|nr:hypothetical protein EVAR_86166_1 [Eumeta japonica]
MRSLRSMCGVSWKDRCRNSDVRERCDLKEDVVTRVERESRAKSTQGVVGVGTSNVPACRKILLCESHGGGAPPSARGDPDEVAMINEAGVT